MTVADNKRALFRDEAINAARTQTLGAIVLVSPLSFATLTGAAALFAAAIVAFLIFGSFTQRSTVSGQLVAAAGLARVYAPQPGIVLERHVVEGQSLKSGEPLFVVSTERSSAANFDAQAQISERVRSRESALQEEIRNTHVLQQRESEELDRKSAGLQSELAQLQAQIQDQRERLRLSEDSVARYKDLKDKDLISGEQLRHETAEMLDQRMHWETLLRDQLNIEHDLAAARAAQRKLSLEQQNQILQITRTLASTSQEFAESELKRRLIISAPESGTATAVLANPGQWVDGSKPLASIVPLGAQLHAELYAPSRAVGFIRPGDTVLIRYQAYPYQKFGHQKGVVESVSRTSLRPDELVALGAPGSAASAEPSYLITVRLLSQTVTAFGQAQALQPGMLLEADILREKRHLYEWALEPLYSLSGKL
jgi:membrane fusion protein